MRMFEETSIVGDCIVRSPRCECPIMNSVAPLGSHVVCILPIHGPGVGGQFCRAGDF